MPTNSRSAATPLSLTLDRLRTIVLDNGQRYEPEWWQQRITADRVSGKREIHIRVPEENGKTTMVAADNLEHLVSHPKPRAVVAARNEKQAKVLYNQALAMVEATPELDRRLDIRDGTNEIRLKGRKGDVGLAVIPADELSAHGGINTRVTIDEMHALPGLGLYRVLSRKLGKRAGAQFTGLSTSGEPDSEYEQMIAGMIEAALTAEQVGPRIWRFEAEEYILWNFGLEKDDDPDDLETVKLANPASWITVDTLRTKRNLPGHDPKHWLQVVCNVPTRDPVRRFLAEGDWDAANIAEDCPEIPKGVPILVGADWGWTDDATCYCPAWFDDGYLLLGTLDVVEPPRNGTDLTPQEALARLGAINERNPIAVIAHDESAGGGGKVMAGLLAEKFPNAEIVGVTSSDADSAPGFFNEQLRAGKLKHTGDPDLKRHLMNAVRVPVKDDTERFRIARPKASRDAPHQRQIREIDGAVAAVNVVFGAVGREPAPEPFFMLL